jgi:hypothetical protein
VRGDEGGASPLTSVFGIGIFLGFLLLAVQVLLHLYATTTVSAAAFDGARLMAAEGGVGCAQATSHVQGLLGTYGGRVQVSCPRTATQVGITVSGPSPAPLVDGFLRGFDLGQIERTAMVRIERFDLEG